jgi:hypothetical protein
MDEARIEVYRLQRGRFRWNWALREGDGQVTKMGQGFEQRSNAILSAKQFNGSPEIVLPNGNTKTVAPGRYRIVLIRDSGQDVGELYAPSSPEGVSFSVKIDPANNNSEARG